MKKLFFLTPLLVTVLSSCESEVTTQGFLTRNKVFYDDKSHASFEIKISDKRVDSLFEKSHTTLGSVPIKATLCNHVFSRTLKNIQITHLE